MMWWNPVLWAAWVLERWWVWRETRHTDDEDDATTEGLNIKGRIMTDISEYRVVKRGERRVD
jgi:hypothetical protein